MKLFLAQKLQKLSNLHWKISKYLRTNHWLSLSENDENKLYIQNKSLQRKNYTRYYDIPYIIHGFKFNFAEIPDFTITGFQRTVMNRGFWESAGMMSVNIRKVFDMHRRSFKWYWVLSRWSSLALTNWPISGWYKRNQQSVIIQILSFLQKIKCQTVKLPRESPKVSFFLIALWVIIYDSSFTKYSRNTTYDSCDN